MNKVAKSIKKVLNIFCWVIVIILVGIVIFSFVSRVTNSNPVIFGYSFYRVASPSMEPELMVGDVILDKTVDDVKQLKVGDVIAFDSEEVADGIPITHKIIKAPYEDIDGQWRLQTQGVANEYPDPEITLDKVRSIMVCKMPVLTWLYSVFLSPWGLIIFFALIIIIFFDEIINIIKILSGHYDTDDKKEDVNDIINKVKRETQISVDDNRNDD